MLYITHLSFDPVKDAITENLNHGYFTIALEADDVDSALDKAKSHIQSLYDKGYLFDPETATYLEVCVEVRSLPEQGLLTFFSRREGERPYGVDVSATLVNAPIGCASSFVEREGDYGFLEPFLVIADGEKG